MRRRFRDLPEDPRRRVQARPGNLFLPGLRPGNPLRSHGAEARESTWKQDGASAYYSCLDGWRIPPGAGESPAWRASPQQPQAGGSSNGCGSPRRPKMVSVAGGEAMARRRRGVWRASSRAEPQERVNTLQQILSCARLARLVKLDALVDATCRFPVLTGMQLLSIANKSGCS